MINLDIQWSDPYKWENKDGELVWCRGWKIPVEYRSPFFAFWKGAKYKMWNEGFSVTKIDDDWYLYETKVCIENFSNIGQEPPSPPLEAEDFWLPPYKVENENGLRPWQIESVSKLVTAINKSSCAIDGSDVGVGKCHSKGTKIRMYDGSLKNVEDIVIGDKLMGDDSTPRIVLSLTNGIDDMYEIVPTNGGISWGCNKEHILILDYKARKQTIEISVKDFLSKYKTDRHNWTLKRVIVNYPYKEVSIDPYLVGLWIGDGTWNSLSVTVNKNDSEIIEELYRYENSYIGNGNSRIYKSKDRINSNCNTYYIRGKERGKNVLWENLKGYGFGKNREKFIPREFLINDISVRKLLLAGLIDSDGWKDKNGCYGIVTKWKRLQSDIIELSRSLGYKVSFSDKISKNNNFGIDGEIYYKTQISGAQ